MSALSATLGNVDISQAYIGTLTVGTSNIAQGAVTRYDYGYVESAAIFGTTFTTVLSFTSFHGAGSPIVEVTFNGAVGAASPSGDADAQYRIICANDGAVLRQRIVAGGGSPSRTIPSSETVPYTPPSGRTQSTFEVQLRATANGEAGVQGGYLRALVMKR